MKRIIMFVAMLATITACAPGIVPASQPSQPTAAQPAITIPTTAPPANQAAIPTSPSVPTEVQPLTLPIEIPVLVIAYYPPAASDPEKMDSRETDINASIADMQQYVTYLVEEGARIAGEGTRFHGYKDPNAPQYLSYQVIERLEFFEPYPRGFPLDNTSYRPDYASILTEQNICDYVDRQGVREVWFYGYHSRYIVPDESRMASAYGDVSNAYPHEDGVSPQFRLPICQHTYVMYNFNYAREIETNIHNRLHQIENVIFFIEGKGYPANENNVRGSLFWDDFSFWGYLGKEPGYRASCGNTHSAPNSVADYTYTSTEIKENNCETWHPDDAQTTYVLSGCEQWHCTEMDFYTWYMQNIPGFNNGIQYRGMWMRNWWDAMADFDSFLQAGRSLYSAALAQPGYVNVTEETAIEQPTLMLAFTPTSPGERPVFEYPGDQQVLDFGENYMFRVYPFTGAEGYLWGFFQGGELVWENLRDEGAFSGIDYNLLIGSSGHALLQPGEVTVMVRALVGGEYSEAAIITVRLVSK